MSNEIDAAKPLTVITGAGGLRFTADIRGHQVVMDQPAGAGGGDTGPSPLELLAVSLGGCVALYATQFCTSRGLQHEGLRVEVATESARGPYRIARFAIVLHLPDALPEVYRAPLERAVRTCPVHNTMVHAPDIEFSIVEPAAAA